VLFGISGWACSFYLWQKIRKLSNKSSGETKRNPSSRIAPSRTHRQDSSTSRQHQDDSINLEINLKKRKLKIFGNAKYLIACLVLLILGAVFFQFDTTTVSPQRASNTKEGHPKTQTLHIEPFPPTDSDLFVTINNSNNNNILGLPDWKTETVNVTDSRGDRIKIVLGVLWDPYKWVKGDSLHVAIDLEETSKHRIEEVINFFQNDEERPLIVVGMASHENADINPEAEIARASGRADKLVEVCGKHFTKNKPHIYSLNLGAFRPDKKPSIYSASERRVVILVIEEGEYSPDLTEGVRRALIKANVEQDFIFDARDYSLFDDRDRFKVLRRLNF